MVLDGRQLGGVGGQGGEDHPLLVVSTTQHLVVVQEELVPHTEPVAALLAGEALQVIDVGSGPHHHLECRDDLLAGRAVARRAKEPEMREVEGSWEVGPEVLT